MKRAVKGCLRINLRSPVGMGLAYQIPDATRCLIGLLFACGLALLCMGLRGDAQNAEYSQARFHVIHAQILQREGVGFTPVPDTVPPGILAANWTPVDLPHARPPLIPPWPTHSRQELPATAVTWYEVRLPDLTHLPAPLVLYIPRWKTHGRIAVYSDTRLVYESRSQLVSVASNHPLWIALGDRSGAASPRSLLIRIEHLRNVDGALSSIWVGSEAALRGRYHAREWLQAQLPAMSSAAVLAIGMFAILVWIRRRHETLYLLYALMSFAAYVRSLQEYIGPGWVPISDAWFGWLVVNSRFWIVALVHLFLVHLHGRSQPWLTRIVIGTATVSGVLTLPWLPGTPPASVIAPLMFVPLLVVANVAFASGVWNARLSGSRDGLVLAGWSLFGMQCGLHDWLLENNLIDIEGVFLSSYVNLGAFFVFMFVMRRRYLGALEEVEQVNTRLEERLQAREIELAESYQRLLEVEQREVLSQERSRLMQDMHDGVGASLISALRMVECGQLERAEIAEMLKRCMEDLKLAIDSMEPIEPDLLLLLATLRLRIGPRIESIGVGLRWEIHDVPVLDWLDPQTSLHILRILQEAFTNVIKHTSSSEIRVATAAEKGGVRVSIIDNGQGFALEQATKNGGRGLLNQMRRAEAIGGSVRWNSSDRGTCFSLWLPVRRQVKLQAGVLDAK